MCNSLPGAPIPQTLHMLHNLQHKTGNKKLFKVDLKSEALPLSLATPVSITTTQHIYTDDTIATEVKKVIQGAEQKQPPEISTTIKLNRADKWKLIGMIFILEFILTMTYGPLAAFLVEMFPLKIRYSSMSLPYHLGFGIFGGICPVIATYLIEKAKQVNPGNYYLAGLSYPLTLMAISLVIGLLYLKDDVGAKSVIAISPNILNPVKKNAGIIWILLAIASAWFGVFKLEVPKINAGTQEDLIFGIIALFIITPVAAIGLLIFGKYALQGEYDDGVVKIVKQIKQIKA